MIIGFEMAGEALEETGTVGMAAPLQSYSLHPAWGAEGRGEGADTVRTEI